MAANGMGRGRKRQPAVSCQDLRAYRQPGLRGSSIK